VTCPSCTDQQSIGLPHVSGGRHVQVGVPLQLAGIVTQLGGGGVQGGGAQPGALKFGHDTM
jgi:hypothetical protein